MENFNFEIKNLNFPEPCKGGWTKLYCEQQNISNVQFSKIRFFDNKFTAPHIFKVMPN